MAKSAEHRVTRLTVEQMRDASAYQIQISRDGESWVPMQPRDDWAQRTPGEHGLTHGGDYWFTSHHEAWSAATALRNALTWSEVRIVARAADGAIIGEQPIE